jgi:hypothetical protein
MEEALAILQRGRILIEPPGRLKAPARARETAQTRVISLQPPVLIEPPAAMKAPARETVAVMQGQQLVLALAPAQQRPGSAKRELALSAG